MWIMAQTTTIKTHTKKKPKTKHKNKKLTDRKRLLLLYLISSNISCHHALKQNQFATTAWEIIYIVSFEKAKVLSWIQYHNLESVNKINVLEIGIERFFGGLNDKWKEKQKVNH